jgi:hypothetical protein
MVEDFWIGWAELFLDELNLDPIYLFW